MGNLLTPFDLFIFFGSLVLVMGVGLWAGRREDTSEDFYLAGRGARWWGVAGSVFGSNVSANHMVGMMGVGFTAGFAQSHFEITAIAGMLVLCYFFLPVYRKLNVYTLSEYLSRRFDDRSRVAYALVMVLIMVVIQMVPGFYIGSRAVNLLLQGGQTATAEAVVDAAGAVAEVRVRNAGAGYQTAPEVVVAGGHPGPGGRPPALAVAVGGGQVLSVTVVDGGAGFDPRAPPALALRGGAASVGADGAPLSPGDTDPLLFKLGILLMALVAGIYTIIGGLKAVIVTDVIQSVLILVAGLIVAVFTFTQPEVGGWAGMMAQDGAGAAAGGEGKMHLFLPSNHPKLPWTGVLTGLMLIHFYFWGTNQFIVQRVLAARTDGEAKAGVIVAGFFKLLIPFFSIGTGVAAFYLFRARGMEVEVDQDVVFIQLMTTLMKGVGFGLVGLVAAGVIGAILSSIDSMLNSAATIFTMDIYRRFINPGASEKKLIAVGRWCIAAFLISAAALAMFTMDPNSEESFFMHIASHQGKLVAGVVVAFFLGLLWPRATGAGAVVAIVAGVVFCYGIPPLYAATLGGVPAVADVFGPKLNFFHTIVLAALLCIALHVWISLATQPPAGEKAGLTWVGLGIHSARSLRRFATYCGFLFALYALLAGSVVQGLMTPGSAACAASAATWGVFAFNAVRRLRAAGGEANVTAPNLLRQDRTWAGLLAASAVYMMFTFF